MKNWGLQRKDDEAQAIVSTIRSCDYVPTESHGYRVPSGIQHTLLCSVLQVSL